MPPEETIFWLPEEFIHHIWSYLPAKNQAQTTAISKIWLNAWRTTPRLNFDDALFDNEENPSRFRHHIDTTLPKFKGSNLQEFSLSMAKIPEDFLYSVSRWLCFASKKGVQILRISLPDLTIQSSYNLPSNVVGTESLTVLCVSRCNFPFPENISCKKLRVLHLISIYNLSSGILSSLINACPMISELKISDNYDDVEEIKVVDLMNLETLCIEKGYASETRLIKIGDVPKLESLEVRLQYGQCRLALHACPNLKSLCVQNANLKDEFFEGLKEKFPNLEFLELSGCFGFRQGIRLLSRNKIRVRVSESWDD